MKKNRMILITFMLILLLSFVVLAIDNPIIGESEDTKQLEIRAIHKNRKNAEYVQLLPDIVYSKINGRELKLHLLTLNREKGPLPLIIFIKGSSWGKYKPQDTFSYIPQLVQFAKNGYVVASVEHRTSHEAKFPAQLHDVKAAVRFLKQHADEYSIDVNRVGVWGTSSGGHLAALLGTSGGVNELEGGERGNKYTSHVQAVVDWYGPTDFLKMSQFSSQYDADNESSAESLVIGGAIQQNKEKVSKANPITYITPDDPPFLIMHGDKDKRVPFNQSELLYEALKKNNIDVSLYKVHGAGHGVSRFSQPDVLSVVQKFFDQYLKK